MANEKEFSWDNFEDVKPEAQASNDSSFSWDDYDDHAETPAQPKEQSFLSKLVPTSMDQLKSDLKTVAQDPTGLGRIIVNPNDNEKDVFRGVAQGGTFGLADELGGVQAALMDKGQALANKLGLASESPSQVDARLKAQGVTGDLGPTDISGLYRAGQKQSEKEFNRSMERSPWLTGAGALAGSLATGSAGLKGVTGLSDLAARSALLGGFTGAATSQGNLTESPQKQQELLKDVVTGGALGAAVPVGVAGASKAISPIVKKASDTTVEALQNSGLTRDIYEAYLRGKLGQVIGGKKAGEAALKQVEDTAKQNLDEVKALRQAIGKRKEPIMQSGQKVDVSEDLKNLRQSIQEARGITDEQKKKAVDLLTDYAEGPEVTRTRFIPDEVRALKEQQKIEDLREAQEKAMLASTRDLDKKLKEKDLIDTMLNRNTSSQVDQIQPSGKDLLALRKTMNAEGEPVQDQIVKGIGKTFNREIPAPSTPIKAISENVRQAPGPQSVQDMDELLQSIRGRIKDARTAGDEALAVKLQASMDKIRGLQGQMLGEEGSQALNNFNKQYNATSDYNDILGIDDKFLRNDVSTGRSVGNEKGMQSILKDLAGDTKGAEATNFEFNEALNRLKEANPDLAKEIGRRSYESGRVYDLNRVGNKQLQTSNVQGSILGTVAGAGIKAGNVIGRLTGAPNQQQRQLIMNRLEQMNVPEAYRLNNILQNMGGNPTGQKSSAIWFKVMQNPEYRNLIDKVSGGEEGNEQ